MLDNIRTRRNKIFFFGNGASAAFANHMALDFSKNGKILSVLINSIGSASFRNELNEVEIQETLRYLSMLSASSN